MLTNADDLYNMANKLNAAPKDIRVGHLNICSLRNKIDELRLIQNICRFDILGISETHLNSTDTDRDIHIDGCVLYCIVNVIHPKGSGQKRL